MGVPPLADTLQRYLTSCAPFCRTAGELAEQRALCAALLEEPTARARQAWLEQLADASRRGAAGAPQNWLHDMWLTAAYWGWPDSLVGSSNVGGWLYDDAPALRVGRTQAEAAAAMTTGLLRHAIELAAGRVPPPAAGRESCMDQHRAIYGTTRLPGAEVDALSIPPPPSVDADADAAGGGLACGVPPARHIAVIHRDAHYRVDVLAPQRAGRGCAGGASGELLFTEAELESVMDAILAAGEADAAAGGAAPLRVGALTGLPRPEWHALRAKLDCGGGGGGGSGGTGGSAALRDVESALFVLNLDGDGAGPTTSAPDGRLHRMLSQEQLYGGALLWGGENRWFDKSLQLIVSASAQVMVNIEHSWAEASVPLGVFCGPAAASAREALRRGAFDAAQRRLPPSVARAAAVRLRWELGAAEEAELRAAAERADAQLRERAADADLRCGVLREFSAQSVKACGVHPDSALQLALQLAYARLRASRGDTASAAAAAAEPVGTYETVPLTRFAQGRTETCRVASVETAAFVRAMLGGAAAPGSAARGGQRAAFEAAAAAHIACLRAAQNGEGVDRHLLALRLPSAVAGCGAAATVRGLPAPPPAAASALWETAAFTRSGGRWLLSTSNNSYLSDAAGGFAAVDAGGYGFGYLLQRDRVHVSVHCSRACPDTDAAALIEAYRRSLADIHDLCGAAGALAPSKL